MTYSLSLRPRALAEIEAARDRYKLVGHGDSFVDELDAVFEVITAMPLRFPLAYGGIHRALLRRYPFAVFFRIRPNTEHIVVLAVFPQRGASLDWFRRPEAQARFDLVRRSPARRAARAARQR
jgi:plasmid stabilization system protein ParE